MRLRTDLLEWPYERLQAQTQAWWSAQSGMGN